MSPGLCRRPTSAAWWIDDVHVTNGDPLPPAQIGVDPASLSSTVDAGNSTVETLTISNLGGADLTWTIFEDASPAGARSTLLYDQTAGQTLNGVSSTYDLDDAPNWVTQAADDFVVPAGETWLVDRVVVSGFY